MIYKFNNIAISNYGATPIRKNEALGVENLYSMPKRVQPTERDWGTSIEPYLSEEDIKLEAHTLTLNVMLNGSIDDYVNACINCSSLSVGTQTFNVIYKDSVDVTIQSGLNVIQSKFYIPNFTLTNINLYPNSSGNYRLDNYDLKQFGIVVERVAGIESISERIEVATTDVYAKTEYRKPRIIDITCSMVGVDPSDLYSKMRQLQAVLMQNGERKLYIKDVGTIDCYLKDGINAKLVHEQVVKFNLRLVEVVEFEID